MKNKILFAFLAIFLISCSQQPSYAVKPGNEGFILGNSTEIGVLLTHGFEASPHEVKELAEYLAGKNITVYVVRLKGHGTDIRDIDNAKWQDWHSDYENAYNELSKKTKKVVVAGHSLGGALALYLAEQKDTAAVISLASPIGLKDKRAEYAWLIKYFKKYEPRNITNEDKKYYYDKYSAAGVEQLAGFIKIYKKGLPKITEPILIIQLVNDTKIDDSSAGYIYKNVNSSNKKILMINATGHSLLEEKFKKEVFGEIYGFIRNI